MIFDLQKFQKELLTTDPLVVDIWDDRYRFENEVDVSTTRKRVVNAVCKLDMNLNFRDEMHAYTQAGYFIPAGRVNAGAGTGRAVTLGNCFVQATIQDSMPGIQYSIARGAFTMQQGGGIGSHFSTIRPAGAIVGRTGSVSTGIIPFADQQSAMCETIKSAGSRRGAMMLTLSDTHPDLWNERQFETALHPATGEPFLTHPSFISAKRQKGRLMGFNVSVLVSDKFMAAIDRGDDWDLGFHVPRADGNHVDVYDVPFTHDEIEMDNDFRVLSERDFFAITGRHYCKKGDLLPWYVYTRVKARRIWDDMIRMTYKYAEPGIIFIDRVNDYNNLKYCETISATNPCGEQPLPPEGVCCLSSVNTAFMVRDPFTPHAQFDYDLFKRVTKAGVRFVDNVLDVSNYPLEAQRLESMNKRRVGLGPTGWADALIQLGVTYGSQQSIDITRSVARIFKIASYEASCDLAEERGSFLKFNGEELLKSPNISTLPASLQERVKNGLRNGVLNTIAPNGTISIYTGNISSGHEPVFSFQPTTRTVKQQDGSGKKYQSMPYSLALYRAMFGQEQPLTGAFVGAMDVSIDGHLGIHAAWQDHIDASISKTINCPTEMNFEDFKLVYTKAYTLGCKGCTTYRFDPDSGRGSVLKEDEPLGESIFPHFDVNAPMPSGTATPPVAELFSDEVINEAAIQGATAYSDMTRASVREPSQYWPAAAKAILNSAKESLSLEVMRDVTSRIETPNDASASSGVSEIMPPERVAEARRYKLTWPQSGENWYITCTRVDNTPFEVFINTTSAQNSEWVQTLSRLLTAILRRGGDVRFLVHELQQIHSASGGAFIRDQHAYRASVVAAIGGVLEEEFRKLGILHDEVAEKTEEDEANEHLKKIREELEDGARPRKGRFRYIRNERDEEIGKLFDDDPPRNYTFPNQKTVSVPVTFGTGPDSCPECGSTPLVHEQGCVRCLQCSYNKCG